MNPKRETLAVVKYTYSENYIVHIQTHTNKRINCDCVWFVRVLTEAEVPAPATFRTPAGLRCLPVCVLLRGIHSSTVTHVYAVYTFSIMCEKNNMWPVADGVNESQTHLYTYGFDPRCPVVLVERVALGSIHSEYNFKQIIRA